MSVISYLQSWFGASGVRPAVKDVILSDDPTANYDMNRQTVGDLWVREMPLFNLWMAKLMLGDPVVTIGLQTRNAALSAAEIKVEASNPKVKDYVEKLHKLTWNRFGATIRRTKHYGFQGLQFDYEYSEEDKRYYPTQVKHFSPWDVVPLTHKGRTVAFRVKGRRDGGGLGNSDLIPPRGVWLTYDTENNPYFGQAITRRSYGPWYEKWMRHGYKKLSQQRMFRDAYHGEIFYYPADKTMKTETGKVIPWSQITRQIGESRLSGATINLPTMYDDNGNKILDYIRPQDMGTPTGILEWGKGLDTDIWYGLEVPPEIIKASSSGSGFSGRSVPFLLFLSSCNDEHTEYVNALDAFMYRPLVWLAYGPQDYTVTCTPLAETFVEDIAGSSIGGASLGGSHGDRAYPGTKNAKQEAEA